MSALLQKAEQHCHEHKYRLTRPRLEVLRIIDAQSKPIRAYDILEKLAGILRNPKPPTAYRAIEFWQSHGFIHRIESLNAYVTCSVDHHHRGSEFMICEICGEVQEAHLCSLPDSLARDAKEKNFTPAHWNVEIHGRCGACQNVDS